MSSKRQQTRSNILDSALKLLVERGYYGVGLEEVARNAGVSRQALYLHFKSKSELLVAMAQYNDENLNVPELIRIGVEADTALESLDSGIQAYGVIEPQIYEIANLVYSARRSDEAADAVWHDRMAYRRENARRIMERLHREGYLADGWTVDEATDFAWGLLSTSTYELLVVERGWSIEQFLDRLRTMLYKVLIVEPDQGKH